MDSKHSSPTMELKQSEFAAAMDKIVADCNDRLEWVRFSKNDLTKEAARVLIEQWSSFTRHSRQCWAHVVGNCPIMSKCASLSSPKISTKRKPRKAIRTSRSSRAWAWRWD